METGAMTVPLQKPGVPRPAAPGAATAPMAGGSPTAALPKATVKLQQTQPMAKAPMVAPPSAPVKRAAAAESQQFYEEKDPDAGMTPTSVVTLVLAVVAMAVQLFGSERVMPAPADQPSNLMVPQDVKVEWESKDAAGQWKNSFAKMLPDVPQ
jgi:hypothetical protein